jgi:hypothetical protein
MVKWGQIVDPMVPTGSVTVIKCMQNTYFRNLEVILEPGVWMNDKASMRRKGCGTGDTAADQGSIL